MIGLMAAVFFGTMTLSSTMSTRVLRSEIGGEIGGLRAEMNARLDSIDVRFEAANGRIDGLDHDIQFLIEREVNSDN